MPSTIISSLVYSVLRGFEKSPYPGLLAQLGHNFKRASRRYRHAVTRRSGDDLCILYIPVTVSLVFKEIMIVRYFKPEAAYRSMFETRAAR